MEKKGFAALVPLAAALILEILPYGAVCNFARPAEDGIIGRFRVLYSYFDLVPFGYANFGPFLTAILTCVILVLTVACCLTGKRKILPAAKALLCAAIVLSLCPLLLGADFFSVVGALITASLGAGLFLLSRAGTP